MKNVDMETVDLVHSGESWPYPQPPCSRQMLPYLERNEGLVTWVQPKNGTVQDQYPVIRIVDRYYTMSLRMMKAVWRNVRLKKGFANVEKAPFGGEKLRIPTLLYVEKMRTQSRFNLMRMEVDSGSPLTPPPPPPAAHSNHAAAGSPPSGAEADANSSSSSSSNNNNNNNRKVVHNASSKVSLVVQRMLLPIIQTPLRSHVVFDVEEDQVELDLIEQLGKKNPGVLEDQTGLTFIQHLQGLFDRYKWWRSPSGAYSRVAVYPSGSRRRRMVVEEPSSSPSFVQSS